jgi:hypothetical protein
MKFTTVGIAMILAGLVLGLTPISVGDTDYSGYSCGSAFFTSDSLSTSGHEECLLDGGAANRRIAAFALLVAGLFFLFAPGLWFSESDESRVRAQQERVTREDREKGVI